MNKMRGACEGRSSHFVKIIFNEINAVEGVVGMEGFLKKIAHIFIGNEFFIHGFIFTIHTLHTLHNINKYKNNKDFFVDGRILSTSTAFHNSTILKGF